MTRLDRRAGRHSAAAQSPTFAERGAVADRDRDVAECGLGPGNRADRRGADPARRSGGYLKNIE